MKLIMFPVALFCFFILLVQPASAQDTFAYKGEYFGNDGYKITVLGKKQNRYSRHRRRHRSNSSHFQMRYEGKQNHR